MNRTCVVLISKAGFDFKDFFQSLIDNFKCKWAENEINKINGDKKRWSWMNELI